MQHKAKMRARARAAAQARGRARANVSVSWATHTWAMFRNISHTALLSPIPWFFANHTYKLSYLSENTCILMDCIHGIHIYYLMGENAMWLDIAWVCSRIFMSCNSDSFSSSDLLGMLKNLLRYYLNFRIFFAPGFRLLYTSVICALKSCLPGL